MDDGTAVLGVDLGTTFTAAAALVGGELHTVRLTSTADMMPSTVFAMADGTLAVGETAEAMAASDPTRVARYVKRRLGDEPLYLGGETHSVETLMTALLIQVVARATEQFGAAPQRLVLTHPAEYSAQRLELMRQIAAGSGIADRRLLPEPVAAARRYASGSRLAIGSALLVYDLGGGTFDACVVSRGDSGFQVLGTPAGDGKVGGVDIDDGLFDLVDERTDGRLRALDPDDPVMRRALVRIRAEVRKAKEFLSEGMSYVVPIDVHGAPPTVELTRGDVDGVVLPLVRPTIQACRAVLTGAGVDPRQLAGILMVGGSTRIPAVRSAVTTALHLDLLLDHDPLLAVAGGAALSTVPIDPPMQPVTPPPAAVTAPTEASPFIAAPSQPRRVSRRVLIGTGAAVVVASAGGAFALSRNGGTEASGLPTSTTGDSTVPAAAETATPPTVAGAGQPETSASADPTNPSTTVASTPGASSIQLDGFSTIRGDVAGQLLVQRDATLIPIDLGGDVFDARVSPDGRRIAVVRRIGGRRTLALASMSAGTATVGDIGFDGEAADVGWHPDGTSIVFTGTPPGGSSDVYTYEIASASTTAIAASNSTDQFPAWSPDGTQLSFVSDRVGGVPSLFVTELATGSTAAVALPGPAGRSTWIDAGTIVVATSFDGSPELVAVTLADGTIRRLTTSEGEERSPVALVGDPAVLVVVGGANGSFVQLVALDGSTRNITSPGSGDGAAAPLTAVQLDGLFG